MELPLTHLTTLRHTHLQREHGKADSALLATGQGVERLQTRHSSDAERSEMLSVLLFGLSGELLGQERYRRQAQIELVEVMLGKVPDT